MKVNESGALIYARSFSRVMMRSALNSIVSRKISVSGMKVISVPVCFFDCTSAMTCSFCFVVPRSNDIA